MNYEENKDRHKNLSRRNAIKKMALATVGIFAAPYTNLSFGQNFIKKEDIIDSDKDALNDLTFIRDWTQRLLYGIEKQCSEKTISNIDFRKALAHCSEVCFEKNGFKEQIGAMKNFDEFVDVCHNEYGWIVDYDKSNGILICNENKDHCLCPIARSVKNNLAGTLCHCTETELERMFSMAYKGNVKATVLKSILRGNDRCIYKIELLDKY